MEVFFSWIFTHIPEWVPPVLYILVGSAIIINCIWREEVQFVEKKLYPFNEWAIGVLFVSYSVYYLLISSQREVLSIEALSGAGRFLNVLLPAIILANSGSSWYVLRSKGVRLIRQWSSALARRDVLEDED